jgi:hypothetical protein
VVQGNCTDSDNARSCLTRSTQRHSTMLRATAICRHLPLPPLSRHHPNLQNTHGNSRSPYMQTCLTEQKYSQTLHHPTATSVHAILMQPS